MLTRIGSLFVLGLAATLVATSSVRAMCGSTAARGFQFQMPSRNISCGGNWTATTSRIECWVFSTRGYAWLFDETGPVRRIRPCDRLSPYIRVLSYGRLLRRGPLRCSSKRMGLRCWSVISGHGFFLNRTVQRTF